MATQEFMGRTHTVQLINGDSALSAVSRQTGSSFLILNISGNWLFNASGHGKVQINPDSLGFFGATPTAQDASTGGLVTAGDTWTTTEQAMLNDLYTMARNKGLLT